MQCLGLLGRGPEFDAAGRCPYGNQSIGAGDGVDVLGQLKPKTGQRGIALAHAEANPGSAFVGQFGLGKHGVFFQVGQLWLDQLPGHGQQAAIAFEQQPEARLHAAFLGAAGTEGSGMLVDVVEVAGQLALQEFTGIGAADGENAFVG
ncbi:hypothetical protein D3C86_1394300 [compost metagenome]